MNLPRASNSLTSASYSNPAYFPGIPTKTATEGRKKTSSWLKQCRENEWFLQDEQITDIGIQSSQMKLRGNLKVDEIVSFQNGGAPNVATSQMKHWPTCQNKGQEHFRNCFDWRKNPASNHSRHYEHHADFTNPQVDRPYEKLNRQTMESQVDSNIVRELMEMEEYSGQSYPLTAMLHSQSLKYMDFICQRMVVMAMHQFNTWVKSNYTTPNCVSSTNIEYAPSNRYNHSCDNRYPSNMRGGSHLECSEEQCDIDVCGTGAEGGSSGQGDSGTLQGIKVSLDNSRVHSLCERLPIQDIDTQQHGEAFLVNGGMQRTLEPSNRSDDNMRGT